MARKKCPWARRKYRRHGQLRHGSPLPAAPAAVGTLPPLLPRRLPHKTTSPSTCPRSQSPPRQTYRPSQPRATRARRPPPLHTISTTTTPSPSTPASRAPSTTTTSNHHAQQSYDPRRTPAPSRSSSASSSQLPRKRSFTDGSPAPAPPVGLSINTVSVGSPLVEETMYDDEARDAAMELASAVSYDDLDSRTPYGAHSSSQCRHQQRRQRQPRRWQWLCQRRGLVQRHAGRRWLHDHPRQAPRHQQLCHKALPVSPFFGFSPRYPRRAPRELIAAPSHRAASLACREFIPHLASRYPIAPSGSSWLVDRHRPAAPGFCPRATAPDTATESVWLPGRSAGRSVCHYSVHVGHPPRWPPAREASWRHPMCDASLMCGDEAGGWDMHTQNRCSF